MEPPGETAQRAQAVGDKHFLFRLPAHETNFSSGLALSIGTSSPSLMYTTLANTAGLRASRKNSTAPFS